ncbi:MAG: transposase, partial [bacterium]
NNDSHIESAPLPEAILPKSYATPGLWAYIATSKYVDALPLYRIEQQFKRYAIEIPRNTMARWMISDESHTCLVFGTCWRVFVGLWDSCLSQIT